MVFRLMDLRSSALTVCRAFNRDIANAAEFKFQVQQSPEHGGRELGGVVMSYEQF
ncbi:MAG: hypothetical protein KDF59_16075 [Nitrosomonas sp.]|nr:hypothetical protein [Nitrosomonas sp.]